MKAEASIVKIAMRPAEQQAEHDGAGLLYKKKAGKQDA